MWYPWKYVQLGYPSAISCWMCMDCIYTDDWASRSVSSWFIFAFLCIWSLLMGTWTCHCRARSGFSLMKQGWDCTAAGTLLQRGHSVISSVHVLCTLRTGSWQKYHVDKHFWNQQISANETLFFSSLSSNGQQFPKGQQFHCQRKLYKTVYDKININFENFTYCIGKGNANKATNWTRLWLLLEASLTLDIPFQLLNFL